MSMSPEKYASLLVQLLSLFVGHPESLAVTPRFRPSPQGTGGVLDLLVRGNAEDQGRLIGAAGRNAIAFQTVMAAIAVKENIRIFVQVLEPSDGGHSSSVPFVPSRDATRDEQIKNLLTMLSGHLFVGADVISVPTQNGIAKTDFFIQIDEALDPSIEAAMSRIIRGIGKNLGRMVGIHICPRVANAGKTT